MKKLRWYHGIIITLLSIAVLIFLCAPLQYYFGYAGLVFSELLLVVTAIIPLLIAHEKMSEVFPVALPPTKKFWGAIFMYGGVFFAMSVVILLEQIFFQSTAEVSESLGNTITGLSPWMSVVVIALIPAICEELLNRGTILFCFKRLKSNVAAIVISGIMFGIMHLDPVRFLPTAILGCFFAYLSIKTESLFFPMLFHFMNNLISVVSAFSSAGTEVVDGADKIEMTALTFGVLWYYVGISVLLFTVGIIIFNGLKKRSSLKIITIIVSLSIIIISSVFMMSTSFTEEYDDLSADKSNVPIQAAFTVNDCKLFE